MTLPHSMDYLVNGGVLDFDAAAYLNNTNVGGVNYNTNLLGGVQMQAQPNNDGFVAKAKTKMSDMKFLKTLATVALVTVLACVGLNKCKNLVKSIKKSDIVDDITSATKKVNKDALTDKFNTVKDGVTGFFKKVFKK